jgi:hypothetical protein
MSNTRFIMTTLEQLKAAKSKADIKTLADGIVASKYDIAELVRLVTVEQDNIASKASWVLTTITDTHNSLLRPYNRLLLKCAMASGTSTGVKRNVLRILDAQANFDEEIQAALIDFCFAVLAQANETVAVKVFAMSIMEKFSHIYPELKNELQLLLEDGLKHAPTPGFKSRAGKILKRLGGIQL